MKIDYTFIKELRSILFSQVPWQAKIYDDISTKRAKITELQAKGHDTTGLETSIAKLQNDLDEGRYSWNVEPFKDISNAKFLLGNVHLLEDSFLTQRFAPSALTAIKNMLSTNFSKIYDRSVFQQKIATAREVPSHIEENNIAKILQPTLYPEPFIASDFMPSTDDISDTTQEDQQTIIADATKSSPILAQNLASVDRTFLSDIATSWLLISKCYYPNGAALFNVDFPIALALFFNNIADVDGFVA
jgi:hypothetical protein